MMQQRSNTTLSLPSILTALLLLAGCGGGPGADTAPERAAEQAHSHPTTPAGLPPPVTLPAEVGPVPPAPAPVPAPDLGASETIVLAATSTPLAEISNDAQPAWPVWRGTGQPVDGVNCMVIARYHLHSLISIYHNGKRLGFPGEVGRVNTGCNIAYELHMHDASGIVHMESEVAKTFKLGQWFALWQQPLSRDSVAGLAGPVRFYIIDNQTITRYEGNPYDIPMLPHREVLIVTGAPMQVAPKYEWRADI